VPFVHFALIILHIQEEDVLQSENKQNNWLYPFDANWRLVGPCWVRTFLTSAVSVPKLHDEAVGSDQLDIGFMHALSTCRIDYE
jgi:hypothetical protein